MQHQESELNERTRVPLGVAVAAGIFVCMLVLWAGRIEWVASATAENTKNQSDSLKTLDSKVEDYKKDVRDIRQDILMIKCRLKIPDPACLSDGRGR